MEGTASPSNICCCGIIETNGGFCEEYPLPLLDTVISVILPVVITGVATAPEPELPVIEIIGGSPALYPLPKLDIVIP